MDQIININNEKIGLFLSRNISERIIIDCFSEIIKVELAGINSKYQAVFRIIANDDIIVDREEVYKKRLKGMIIG